MSLIKIIAHEKVEGARFGKYNLADNSTAVVYRIGNTVIDTGPPNQWKPVRDYLSGVSFDKVILTHHHEDHSGNGARIFRYFETPVSVHDSGISAVENGFPLKLYQKIIWGSPQTFTPHPLPKRIDTGDGHCLVPIHTPGHSPDHVCFLEPEKKWLFTGDLFLATRPKLFRVDENLDDQIRSLQKVLAHDFKTVFCSHRGVVDNGYALIQKKLDYFTELVGRVRELYSEGNTVSEITRRIFGKEDLTARISFKHICCENLVRECLLADEV